MVVSEGQDGVYRTQLFLIQVRQALSCSRKTSKLRFPWNDFDTVLCLDDSDSVILFPVKDVVVEV